MFALPRFTKCVLFVAAMSLMLAVSTKSRADDAVPAAPVIKGKVVDSTGTGVGGVTVQLYNAPAAGAHHKKGAAPAAAFGAPSPALLAAGGHNKKPALKEAVTASDGTFSFTDLTAGDYLLIAVSKETKTAAHERVTAKTGDSTPITLTLAPHKGGKKAAAAAAK